MGPVRTEEFRKDAARIALSSKDLKNGPVGAVEKVLVV